MKLWLKQYEKAIEDYNKTIKLNPNHETAYYNRGLTYRNLHQHERSIEDFTKAIELNPNFFAAYNDRGLAYKDLGQSEKATEDFNKAKTIEQKKKERGWWWCFVCDTARDIGAGDKCPKCGSALTEVPLFKSSINKERLAYIGILVVVGLLAAFISLNIPKEWAIAGTISILVAIFSLLVVCSYLLIAWGGHYFGMPSGESLFTEFIPSEYPTGQMRRFSMYRLGIEALKSLGILAGGLLIYITISLFR